jgi:hypothetical protein
MREGREEMSVGVDACIYVNPDRYCPLPNYCCCSFVSLTLNSTCLAHVFQSRTSFIEALSSPWSGYVSGALVLAFSSTATPYGWEERLLLSARLLAYRRTSSRKSPRGERTALGRSCTGSVARAGVQPRLTSVQPHELRLKTNVTSLFNSKCSGTSTDTYF